MDTVFTEIIKDWNVASNFLIVIIISSVDSTEDCVTKLIFVVKTGLISPE